MNGRMLASLAGAWAGGAVVGAAIGRRRQRVHSFKGRTVVITGGSRGLGLELARQWGARGARLALCARTARDLERAVKELSGLGYQVFAQPCDIRSQEQVGQFVHAVIKKWGSIDVLVNNAGIIQTGPAACMTLDDYRAAMETHFWGPLYMIEAALPHMRWPGVCRIVNIASIGGEISVPHLLPYCASKFALVGLSEGLRSELARKDIQVTTVCPGLMRTGSPRNALFKGQHRKEYAWFSIGGSLPLLSISSRRAARQIVRATTHGRPYLAVSLPAKLGSRLHGLFPNVASHILSFVARCLPVSGGIGQQNRFGQQSHSRWSPSLLTRLNERAARRNNELG